jgi:hypothetical protein
MKLVVILLFSQFFLSEIFAKILSIEHRVHKHFDYKENIKAQLKVLSVKQLENLIDLVKKYELKRKHDEEQRVKEFHLKKAQEEEKRDRERVQAQIKQEEEKKRQRKIEAILKARFGATSVLKDFFVNRI